MEVVFIARAMLNSSTANLVFLPIGLMAFLLSNAVQLTLAPHALGSFLRAEVGCLPQSWRMLVGKWSCLMYTLPSSRTPPLMLWAQHALLLTRERHLPSRTNSQAMLLPKITVFRCGTCQNLPGSLDKTCCCQQLSPIAAHSGLLCPIFLEWFEMQNAYIAYFHDPISKPAVIAATLLVMIIIRNMHTANQHDITLSTATS